MLRRWPVKASSKHCSLLKGLCQNNPLLHHWSCPPLPLGLGHPYTVRTVPRLSACADQDTKPSQFLETALAWSRAAPGVRRKHSGHVLTNSYRYIYIYICCKSGLRLYISTLSSLLYFKKVIVLRNREITI